MRKSFYLILSVLIILAGVVTATAAYYNVVYVQGADHIKSRSLSYYIFIPKFIRDFPIIDPVSEPVYYRRPEIVCESPEAVMEYRSGKNMVELTTTYSEELNERGISMEERQVDSGKWFYLNPDASSQLILRPTGTGQTDIAIMKSY